MPKKRLPAIANRASWIKWDSVVEKVWKYIGGNQEERRRTVHREVCGVQDRSKRKYRNTGKASA